ncbi:mycofactocin system transcriptional regulator [Streptomyces sp. NPDC102360]|uniref:mycofactocin system transcriptional regulator n=1 Tax=Streptomyces sp. NPDC102360 TaxID=3366160 RepID=UPI0038034F01
MDSPRTGVAEPVARAPRSGRPRATTRADLERIGFELFARQGFDATTVDDIASAAGIARRTFFRYFASKNDLVWGDFEQQLTGFRELLHATGPSVALMTALRAAVVDFNRFDATVVPWHRERMRLILTVPTLQADATLRYAAWRAIVTDFAARRLGLAASDALPRLFGHAVLAAAVTAYEHWLAVPEAELSELLDTAIRRLEEGLGGASSSV